MNYGLGTTEDISLGLQWRNITVKPNPGIGLLLPQVIPFDMHNASVEIKVDFQGRRLGQSGVYCTYASPCPEFVHLEQCLHTGEMQENADPTAPDP